ncbi:MAG TPA: hypothetical protein VGT99_13850 [Gammaproteobacteria bacterium]|nr:hypothetical protein [Gammaproteobacteria bacterium]
MTLHLTGRVHSVVYAEMPVVTGEKLRDAHRPAPMAWIAGKLRERRRAGLLRFSMPDIGLSWRQPSQDTDAVTIATYLARVLAEEFPQPEEELARHFHMDIDKLVAHLAETEPTRAGAMQTDDKA